MFLLDWPGQSAVIVRDFETFETRLAYALFIRQQGRGWGHAVAALMQPSWGDGRFVVVHLSLKWIVEQRRLVWKKLTEGSIAEKVANTIVGVGEPSIDPQVVLSLLVHLDSGSYFICFAVTHRLIAGERILVQLQRTRVWAKHNALHSLSV